MMNGGLALVLSLIILTIGMVSRYAMFLIRLLINKSSLALVAVLLSALPSLAQMEFSNLLLGNGKVLSLDGKGNYEINDIDFLTTFCPKFCLSNYEGHYVMYGDPTDIRTCTGQKFSSDYCLYPQNFAFKSPDSKFVYQLLSYHTNNKGNAYIVCYIAPNDSEISQIKEVVLLDTAISWEINPLGLTCAIPHSDGKRMWILVQEPDLKTIDSYLVDGENVVLYGKSVVEKKVYVNYLCSKVVLPLSGEVFYYDDRSDYSVYCLKINRSTGEVSGPFLSFSYLMNSFDITQDGKYLYSINRDEISRFLMSDLRNGVVSPQIISIDIPSDRPSKYVPHRFIRLGIDGNLYIRDCCQLHIIKNVSSETPVIEELARLGYRNYIGLVWQNYLRPYTVCTNPPSAQFDNASLCYGEPLNVILGGEAPFSVDYTLDGKDFSATDISTEIYRMPDTPGRYSITKVSDRNCSSAPENNNNAVIGKEMKAPRIKIR